MGRPAPRTAASPWLTVIVLCVGQMMIVIDQNIVNVALPSVRRALGLSSGDLVWVVNAYVIPFGGLLLLAGRLGDALGRKAVLLTGVALFSGASLLCGLAGDAATLIACRFVQGIGGAVAAACVLGMVATMFEDGRRRAQAIGVYSFASAGGGAVGPLLGGVLTELLDWNWIFFINVPIGAVLLLTGLRVIPADRGRREGGRVDHLGALLVTVGVMLLVHTIVNAQTAGWTAAGTPLLGSLSLLALGGFVVRQATTASPLLPLRLFRSRALVAANLVQFLLIAAMFGLLFFGTLYLQRVLAHSPLRAGLAFVPVAVVIAAVSLGLSARLIARYGPRRVLLFGLALTTAAFLLLSLVRADGTYAVDFLPASLVMGLGFGLAAPSAMGLGMADVRPEESGIASGLFNTAQQMGGAVGLAVLSAVATSRTDRLARTGRSEAATLVGGYHAAFLVAACCALAALAVGALMLRSPAAPGAGTDAGTRHGRGQGWPPIRSMSVLKRRR